MQWHRGNLFLIGLMGAGKTTYGRRLATQLGKPFMDCDAELERRLGCTVSDIFEKEGEASFRDREQVLLAELAQREGIVLSTGGGAVLREANREQLRANGTVVYLHATPEVLAKRLRRVMDRPLLRDAEDPAAQLAQLYAIRDPLYRQTAYFVIEATSDVVAKLAEIGDVSNQESGVRDQKS
ncbi:MAG: shikimate kinase [Burkholderiales bacterium]|jgi:shikimate kinase|nr:shikimate kinase [Burkholderiales bacterium]